MGGHHGAQRCPRATFSVNDSNAAEETIATFSEWGFYVFTVTITDPAGLTATSNVKVNVSASQTLTSITVSPPSVTLGAGTEPFTGIAYDQFGNAMSSQPSLTWSVIGGGSIDSSSGLYTPPYSSGSATVIATSGQVTGTASVTLLGAAQWNSAGSDSWNTNGDWIDTYSGASVAPPGLRGVAGDTVLFASATGSTIWLDGANPSVAGITFDSSTTSYNITSQGTGGVLQLANGGNSASITVSSGSHTISAPVALLSNVSVLPAAGSQLTISGGISGAGQSLTVDGGGTVVLSGANSYTGRTMVSAGTLILSNSSAIAAGASLTVGAGAGILFGAFNRSRVYRPPVLSRRPQPSSPRPKLPQRSLQPAQANVPVTTSVLSPLSPAIFVAPDNPTEARSNLKTLVSTTTGGAGSKHRPSQPGSTLVSEPVKLRLQCRKNAECHARCDFRVALTGPRSSRLVGRSRAILAPVGMVSGDREFWNSRTKNDGLPNRRRFGQGSCRVRILMTSRQPTMEYDPAAEAASLFHGQTADFSSSQPYSETCLCL